MTDWRFESTIRHYSKTIDGKIMPVGRPSSKRKQIAETHFKRLRLEACLSQEDLANRIDASVSSIRRWEKGEEPTFRVEQVKKLCKAFRCSLDELPTPLSEIIASQSSS